MELQGWDHSDLMTITLPLEKITHEKYVSFQNSFRSKANDIVCARWCSSLTFTTLWDNSTDNTLRIVFLFFLENRIWHFMQIVSTGDNLHEMSNLFYWKNKKYFSMSSAENFTQSAKRLMVCWMCSWLYWDTVLYGVPQFNLYQQATVVFILFFNLYPDNGFDHSCTLPALENIYYEVCWKFYTA